MAGSLLARIGVAMERLEVAIASLFGRRFPPDAPCFALAGDCDHGHLERKASSKKPFSMKDLIDNGFVWEWHRRTLEKRKTRRFGFRKYAWKMLIPKTYLKTCNLCGDDYMAGYLCPSCYKRVNEETNKMQEAIIKNLQLDPVETEIVLLYKGEKQEVPDEFWEGKRIVELDRERPHWFSRNLLEKTTAQPAVTTDVKPSELA